MGKCSNVILCIINILGIIFTITTIILANKISDDTEENPLEVYDKYLKSMFDDDDSANKTENAILGFINIFFDELAKLSKSCQCGEKIFHNICTEEQIISGCFDVSKNNKSTILRYLEENCDKIKEKIINKGGFSKVFDLNYDTVHKMAKGILIVLIILSICVYLVILPLFCCELIIVSLVLLTFCVYALSLIINFVFFIVMIANYYSGETGKFLDFYDDCLEDEEKSMDLQNTYKEMNEISKYMMAFLVINIIHIGLQIVDAIIIIKKQK